MIGPQALQVFRAAKVTSEDLTMSHARLSPVELVAYESLFAAVFMLCVILPVAQVLPGYF